MSGESVFALDKVIQWASEITGKGATENREALIDLIRETLDVLYQQESVENYRKWCLYTCNGCITLPREIGSAEKYKIGEEVGSVRGKYYEFLGYVRTTDCEHFKDDLRYLGEFPIYYDLPKHGARVAAQSIDHFECSRDWDKRPYLIVQGKDLEKKEVFTNLNTGDQNQGITDQGERIYLAEPGKNPAYSRTIFSEISSVRIVNAPLNIRFVWCNSSAWQEHPHEVGPLATYDAGDEFPGFRRYFIPGVSKTCCLKIDILGKLRMPALRYDNELIRGFDSFTLRGMLSANHYRGKNDINAATFNSNLATGQLRKKNENIGNKDTDMFAPFIPTSAAKFPQTY